MITEENTSNVNISLHSEIRNFYGDIDCVKILLEHDNCDINVRNSQGETPLHLAAQNPACSAELVKLLLDRGADVNATTPDGNTALHLLAMCCKGSHLVIGAAKTLLKHGSRVNTVNSKFETPLHLAVRNEFLLHYDMTLIKVLRAHGADVSIEDAMGENAFQAFHHASKRYNRGEISHVTTLLLAPVNQLYKKHRATPIHIACLCHNFKLLYKCLNYGFDVNAVDNFGNSPLHYAIIAPGEIDKSILMLMFEYGAVIIKDNRRDSLSWEIAGYSLFTHISKSSYKILVNVFYQYLARKLLVWPIKKHLDRDINVIMLAMAGKYRNFLINNVTTIVDNHVKEYKKLLIRCNEEVKLMRKTKIGESNVSYLDLLLADAKKTFIYTKNKELIKAFNEKKATIFPLYRGMLDAQIVRDIERRKLIEEAAEVLCEVLGFAELSDFFERTLIYCSNQDVRHIIMLKRKKWNIIFRAYFDVSR